MFVNRRSSQKPREDFYTAFKESFPDVGPGTTSAGQGPSIPGPSQQRSASLSEAAANTSVVNRYEQFQTSLLPPSPCSASFHVHDMNSTMSPNIAARKDDSVLTEDYFTRPDDNLEDPKQDQDATPKHFADQWRLTPSLMDPNSFAFSTFANQPPGYYTPTPGGFNTFYHSSAAGDLHTPGMGMNTPLSMPHSLHAMHAHDQSMHYGHFNPQMLQHAHTFHDQFQHQPGQSSQQLFAPPSHFLQHQDSGYEGLEDNSRKVTPNPSDYQNTQQNQSVTQQMNNFLAPPNLPSAEKWVTQSIHVDLTNPVTRFRYHTTLNAPTAMVRSTDEIPITYLNKGQAYTMSIFDTAPPPSHPGVVLKYRTYVRVSFEDEQQRAKPGSCWQLWKEGRGTNEAHQRGGKLLAVEYVDPNQGGDEELRKSQIELEKASFDGFAVTWYPTNRTAGAPDCSISVRFNFLSTDFSHSKGVKGIPVRLCAKTELVSAVPGSSSTEPEVCFSKVKLFRDHGAERKLSNDVAHVKKSIDKLKQQISQAESGMSSMGKRKRSGSMAKGCKPPKHKRTWSADSDIEPGKLSAEEDLHMKLVALQDMFSSTRPVSILFLRGELEDDPDASPVKLPGGEEMKPVQRTATWESRQSGSDSPASNASPTPSSVLLTPKRKFSDIQAVSEEQGNEYAVQDSSMSPGRPVKIQKREHESVQPGLLAIDVDTNYQPPATDRPIKPVACFYIRQKNDQNEYYRAIYLLQRTVRDLVNGIAEKFQIDPHRITQVTHVNAKGLHIIVDEDVVREVPEGQDMVVEFSPVMSGQPVKHEWISPAIPEIVVDGDMTNMSAVGDTAVTDALEMWLNW